MAGDLIQQIISNKRNDSWWKESERKVINRYGPIFNPQNINNLTKEDFKSFLLIRNNLHWEGIHRQGNTITLDMKALKIYLRFLLNEKMSLKERLSSDFIDQGGYWVKGIGKAIMSAILLVVYPQKYGVWNSKSESALKKLNLFPRFLSKDSFADKYLKVNDALLDLAHKYNITLWQLDGVLGEMVGANAFGNIQSEEEVVEEEAREHGISDLVNFGMESHLEDFLIANWEKTIFGKNYELIYEENDLVSQQYQTSVGLIDILARARNEQSYLVIELKKGRSSDAVVGQILRYINWVKEHLANGKMVKGVIVVLDTDEKLVYSLKGLKEVSLYTYKVNFNLNKKEVNN